MKRLTHEKTPLRTYKKLVGVRPRSPLRPCSSRSFRPRPRRPCSCSSRPFWPRFRRPCPRRPRSILSKRRPCRCRCRRRSRGDHCCVVGEVHRHRRLLELVRARPHLVPKLLRVVLGRLSRLKLRLFLGTPAEIGHRVHGTTRRAVNQQRFCLEVIREVYFGSRRTAAYFEVE